MEQDAVDQPAKPEDKEKASAEAPAAQQSQQEAKSDEATAQ